MTTVCVPDQPAAAALGPALDGVDVVVWDGRGTPPPEFARVQFFISRYTAEPLSADVFAQARDLKVVQLLSAGVDPWLRLVPANVVLCSGRGVHGGSTAELAVAGLLALRRQLPRFLDAQRTHHWDHTSTLGLDGARVLVLGVGDIGRRVAAALAVFDAQVTLVARRARDGVHALADLPALLPEQDAVVIGIPLTAQSHQLVDATFLARLPDGAALVNVARGAIVDTAALLAELTAGRLHAFLDVTDPEPLPADHPLWDAPNLLLTPHVGGGTRGWEHRAYALAGEQLQRFRTGVPLHNVVADGY